MDNHIIKNQIDFFTNERDNLVRVKNLKITKLLRSELLKIDDEINQYNRMIDHLKHLL